MDTSELDLINNSKGLRFIHLNTRSLLHKLDELREKLKAFDVIVFSETWLDSATSDSMLNWKDFQLVRRDREEMRNKKGGGVCIYIRSTIDFEIIHAYDEFLGNNIEFLFLKLKPHMQKVLNLFAIYRPPDGKHGEFVKATTRILDQIDRSHSETMIIGDFNINFKNKKLVSSSKLDLLENKYGLKQVIHGFTRITDNTSTCIDLLFTDMSNIIKTGTINYNISDHLPIYLIKKKIRNKVSKIDVVGRSYLRYDKGVFDGTLKNQDWTLFETSIDPTELWNCFSKNVSEALDTLCPIKSLKVVDHKPEWLTNDLLIRMRERDKAFRKARRTKCQAD